MAFLGSEGTQYVVTKVKTLLADKADAATTIAGYGITDAYTKDEVDGALSDVTASVASVYRVKGSITYAALEALSDMEVGDVYNITDDFTMNGTDYPAGTNLVYTGVDDGWDALAGTYDLSNYVTSTDLTEITTDEIDAMFA